MTASPHAAPVKTCAELQQAPAEYRHAVEKIVISHAINELHGAQVFDEPAIKLAPTPYAKWLTCRVAMEEYGHHVRFRELGEELGIPAERMIPGKTDKKALSIFDFPLQTWTEFCVIKLLADLGEILQVEDLAQCSFLPLRNLSRMTMPEERFHAEFGREFCTELCQTEQGRQAVQDAVNRYFPMLPGFFGKARSKNNETFRKWGIKQRTNEAMLEDFLVRAKAVCDELGLTLPDVSKAA